MIGDKLLIGPDHTERARDLVEHLQTRLENGERLTMAVCGESGAGKSELAEEIRRLADERGFAASVLQQDDYFMFPPKTNEEMRRRNIEQVGPFEVKVDFLDSALRSYKRGETKIFKPLVLFDEDRIVTEEVDVSEVVLLIAEGTYTGLLEYADICVFIDRTFRDTRASRLRRSRESQDDFLEEVLLREHRCISASKEGADYIISSDFGSVSQQTISVRRKSAGGEIPQGGTL